MKCLLCNFESNNPIEVRKYYLANHNVDENNRFFVKLLKESEQCFSRKEEFEI